MDFQEVDALIPRVTQGKKHSVVTKIYDGVVAKQPGKHSDTTMGGDAGIAVTDTAAGWKNKLFKHDDLFIDVEAKVTADMESTQYLMNTYYEILMGESLAGIIGTCYSLPGLTPLTFLHTVQALSVIEHRRYAQHEAAPMFGGKFLPFRFSAGIAEKRWTAGHAIMGAKRGRPAVEALESQYGLPLLTEMLMADD